jgi:hypothetical protein
MKTVNLLRNFLNSWKNAPDLLALSIAEVATAMPIVMLSKLKSAGMVKVKIKAGC